MTREPLTATTTPKSTLDGFFQISLECVDEIVKSGLGPDELAAYIVLVGGVNGHDKGKPRASTHGPQSIQKRTLMSRSPAAVDAIKALSANGFVSSALDDGAELPANAKSNRETARWFVDKDSDCYLAIGQGFLQPKKDKKPKEGENPRDKNTHPSTLAHLCNEVCNADDIPYANALIDALLVFFHLHEYQDFGKFGGVDPGVAHGRFRPVENNEECEHVMPLAGLNGWSLVTEQAPKDIILSDAFVYKALNGVPLWEGAPSLEVRAAHALEQLKKADLIYQAHVVWDSDPVNKRPARHPVPLFTLYVIASRTGSNLELQLQPDVHDALLKTKTYTGVQIYGESRGQSPKWKGTKEHRYIVPTSKVGEAVLLAQLRVRWWPNNADTCNAQELDRQRVRKWQKILSDSTDNVSTVAE